MSSPSVLVMGASGSVGRLIVKGGLTRSYAMTGFVRAADSQFSKDVRLIVGDALDPEAVSRAVAAHCAVIYALGAKTLGPTTFFSESTRILLDAMRHHRVARLVAITGVGAGDTRGHGGVVYDRIIFPLFTRNAYNDKDRQEVLIRDSGVEFTLVRPASFRNHHAPTPLRVLTNVNGAVLTMISRQEVADFVLDQVLDRRFIRQAVFVGHP